MTSAPVKGNGDLYQLTDVEEYDRRTGGWISRNFPETFSLQKSMPQGREHEQFRMLKDLALSLGKVEYDEAWLKHRIAKIIEAKLNRKSAAQDKLKKVLSDRLSRVDQTGQL